MTMENPVDIISNGEGRTVKFKKSREKPPSDVYQSICAFVNRNGGKVFLGVEDDIFRIIIPLTEQVTEQATEQVAEQVKKLRKIIDFCETPRSTAEIMKYLGLKHREHFRSKILQPLLAQGILAQTMPDAPKSPKQKYYSAGPNESGKFDKNGYP